MNKFSVLLLFILSLSTIAEARPAFLNVPMNKEIFDASKVIEVINSTIWHCENGLAASGDATSVKVTLENPNNPNSIMVTVQHYTAAPSDDGRILLKFTGGEGTSCQR